METHELTLRESAQMRVTATQILVRAGKETQIDLDAALAYQQDVEALAEAEELGEAIRKPKNRKLLAKAIEAAERLAA